MNRCRVVSLLLFAAAAVSAPMVPVRERTVETDAITGSLRHSDNWIGIYRVTWLEASPLEAALNYHGIAWQGDWRTINVNRYSVFGRAISHGCSSAPPIYQLRPLLDTFAARSTPEELRQFVLRMECDAGARQASAVSEAAERVLDDEDDAQGK